MSLYLSQLLFITFGGNMLKIKAGDLIDASAWDCLQVTKVKSSGVNVEYAGSNIPTYFSYSQIDGWSNGKVSLHNHGFGIWLAYDAEKDNEYCVNANDVNEAIYQVNCGAIL